IFGQICREVIIIVCKPAGIERSTGISASPGRKADHDLAEQGRRFPGCGQTDPTGEGGAFSDITPRLSPSQKRVRAERPTSLLPPRWLPALCLLRTTYLARKARGTARCERESPRSSHRRQLVPARRSSRRRARRCLFPAGPEPAAPSE